MDFLISESMKSKCLLIKDCVIELINEVSYEVGFVKNHTIQT